MYSCTLFVHGPLETAKHMIIYIGHTHTQSLIGGGGGGRNDSLPKITPDQDYNNCRQNDDQY